MRLSLTLGTAPGGVKAALRLLGKSIGPCRSPVGPLSPDKQQKMRACPAAGRACCRTSSGAAWASCQRASRVRFKMPQVAGEGGALAV